MRYHKNSPLITFQHMYANLLSSKITQRDKFTKAGNFTKIFSSETFIETSNIFAIKGKKPFLFQLRVCKRDTQSQNDMQLNKFLTVHIKPFSKEP